MNGFYEYTCRKKLQKKRKYDIMSKELLLHSLTRELT
jgi:hypothetical protein